ncbi:hypothetical protein [Pseudomonas anguilliseptica]|nr:hypothetical protein [Pseudomonas anguilliseptica]
MSVFEQQRDASAANLKQNPADSPPGKPKRRCWCCSPYWSR